MLEEKTMPFAPRVDPDRDADIISPNGSVLFGGMPNTRMEIHSVHVYGEGCFAEQMSLIDVAGEYRHYPIATDGKIPGAPRIDPATTPFVRVKNYSAYKVRASVTAEGTMGPWQYRRRERQTSRVFPLSDDVQLIVLKPEFTQDAAEGELTEISPETALFGMYPIQPPALEPCRLVLPPHSDTDFCFQPYFRISLSGITMRSNSDGNLFINLIQVANINHSIGARVPVDHFYKKRAFKATRLDPANRMTISFANDSPEPRWVEVDLSYTASPPVAL